MINANVEEKPRAKHLQRLLFVAALGGGLVTFMLLVRGVTGFLFVHEKREFVQAAQLLQPAATDKTASETPAALEASADQEAFTTFVGAAGYFRTQSALIGQHVRTGRVELWLDRAREESRMNSNLYPTEGHYLMEQLTAWSVAIQSSTKYQMQPNATTMAEYQNKVEAANQGAPVEVQISLPTVEAIRVDADTASRFRAAEGNFLDVLAALQDWSNASSTRTPKARTGQVQSDAYNASLAATVQAAQKLVNRAPGGAQ
jgi:hypothetical protein